MRLFPVIMAGGSGTRFWPLSRKARPKQFLPLASEQPLLVDTVQRVEGLASLEDTLVVCGPIHAPTVRKLVKGLPRANVVVEPVARNTAPAIALAALHVARRDPAGILVVLPSDHHVARPAAFRKTLAAAAKVAAGGSLVTLGIQPNRPETGYGYLRVGEALAAKGGKPGVARKVAAFVEKPDLATAKQLSGAAASTCGTEASSSSARTPFSRRCVSTCPSSPPDWMRWRPRSAPAARRRRWRRLFPRFPSISIDYGVMEKADNLALVPGDFGWSDVGSFAALPDVREQDAAGNVISGKGAVVLDSEGCVVLADKRPIAVVGMKDTVVVDAGDTLLVVPRERAQEVRKAVEAFKARKLTRYL